MQNTNEITLIVGQQVTIVRGDFDGFDDETELYWAGGVVMHGDCSGDMRDKMAIGGMTGPRPCGWECDSDNVPVECPECGSSITVR